MFPNQVPGFVPINGPAAFNPSFVPRVGDVPQTAARLTPPVQISDIYQAAKNRAVEDHELDKLFNPDFYGDAI